MEVVAACNNEFHQLVVDHAGSEYLSSFLSKVVQIPLVLQTFRRYDSSTSRAASTSTAS